MSKSVLSSYNQKYERIIDPTKIDKILFGIPLKPKDLFDLFDFKFTTVFYIHSLTEMFTLQFSKSKSMSSFGISFRMICYHISHTLHQEYRHLRRANCFRLKFRR